MPDLTGLPALDVLIGMAFLFFLLATVVASINEVIQTMLNARARMLERGLRTLLEDDEAARKFFREWRIKRLAKPAGAVRKALEGTMGIAERRDPSYVPARAFALTVLEAADRETDPIGAELVTKIEESIETLGIASLDQTVAATLTEAQQLAHATRLELERSFDEVMDRASGWYKRYVQWWLLALALLVAIGLNVNTFTVAERLWKDDALRASIVQEAQKVAGAEPPTADKTPQAVADEIDQIEQLKLPIGWTDENTKGGFLGRLAGWIVTAAAITLGAPFWFDVLGKLARLRSTGSREGTAKDDARAPDDRDDPSRD